MLVPIHDTYPDSSLGSLASRILTLIRHLKPNTVKVHVYHGHNRKGVISLTNFDIVITTFHTVSSIWRKRKDSQDDSNSIFSIPWHRIVLDEGMLNHPTTLVFRPTADIAHIIQNANNQLAQSCCALRAVNRWAITGTPIQNKLSDFASIVSFLRVHPYSCQDVFDEEISKPWRRVDPLGFLRLKTLVRAITIARTKAVVHLPPREDFIYHLDFTSAENQLYEDAKKQTVALLRDAISSSQAKTTFNALQRLNTLRLICSHGLLAQSNRAVKASGNATPCEYPEAKLDVSFNSRALDELLGGHSTCSNCGANLLEEFMEGQLSADQGFCHNALKGNQTLCWCCKSQLIYSGLRPPSPAQYLNSPGSPMSIDSSPSTDESQLLSLEFMPTKIKALVKDLVQYGFDEKR